MRKKKLLILNSFYSPTVIGGAEISTQLLAEALTKYYEVYVLATGAQRRKIEVDHINGVTVCRIPCLNIYWPGDKKDRNILAKLIWHLFNVCNPIQKKVLENIIKRINPDIIHTQNLMGLGTYIWGIANKYSIPVVHTLRDYALFQPVSNKYINKIIEKINRKRSGQARAVVGISDYILNQHLNRGFFKDSFSTSIHNVVKSERYPKKIRSKGEPLIIGYFGQLEKNKGVELLFKVISELDASIVKEVIICGTGKEETNLKIQAKNDPRIIFKGKVSHQQVQKIMAQVDLTIVPSIWEEPFGRVIIESYAQGTPVIASNIGGIPEVIYKESYLFNPSNSKELKDKIIDFYHLDRKDLEREIEGLVNYSQRFRDNVPHYIQVYNRFSS
ncbi:glycosyltransferase family 4 protein [Geobacillus thermodenitrificans]|uniref:glycosyltransferase family 4 protein n=1 Tax=Geobacillus thermodenitrificans TaxID=33940 RepID=UPI00040F7324|nr:glycosyltransferase family 4 protein [Geobacillus thermodenitrificans]ARA98319.1 glycoside hydrolase [Geobacillus thermodenitrificans]